MSHPRGYRRKLCRCRSGFRLPSGPPPYIGYGAIRQLNGDVLRTSANYPLPAAPWSIVIAVQITASNGSAPFNIFSWDFVSGVGGLSVAFSTTTAPDRIRATHTRLPATPVTGELVFLPGFADITTIGRFKILMTYDGATFRARFAKGASIITSGSINSVGAIALGTSAFPVIEMEESVGGISWAMGNIVISEAAFLAANENNWNMPKTLIATLGGSLVAGRTFSDPIVSTIADVDFTGSLLGADPGVLNAGTSRLTSEP